MASKIIELTPDGSDYSNGSDFSLSAGSDLDALLSDSSATTFISATAAGKHNTLTFSNPSISFESVNWIQIYIVHSNTAGGVTSTVDLSLLNGGAIGNPEFDVTDGVQATLLAPPNPSKVSEIYSDIFPYSDGTDVGDVFTSGNLDNIKLKIETDSVSNTLQIMTVKIYVNLNISNPAAISTYPAKRGMSVRRGKITIR